MCEFRPVPVKKKIKILFFKPIFVEYKALHSDFFAQ